jgi:hypothetical protein
MYASGAAATSVTNERVHAVLTCTAHQNLQTVRNLEAHHAAPGSSLPAQAMPTELSLTTAAVRV